MYFGTKRGFRRESIPLKKFFSFSICRWLVKGDGFLLCCVVIPSVGEVGASFYVKLFIELFTIMRCCFYLYIQIF